MFSYFKRTCKKTEKENTYELTVDYDKSDESEVVIKILMFGPNMKVLEPIDVSDKVNQRISKQKELNARLIWPYKNVHLSNNYSTSIIALWIVLFFLKI